jgi:hypothetical protein
MDYTKQTIVLIQFDWTTDKISFKQLKIHSKNLFNKKNNLQIPIIN